MKGLLLKDLMMMLNDPDAMTVKIASSQDLDLSYDEYERIKKQIMDAVEKTFMPKPVYGEAGNGMHVHMLLKKKGKNIFYKKDAYGNLSDTAMYFIGGLLKHINSLCALCNPSTNSYKRLVPGFEAPVTVGYACANRSAIIRIPSIDQIILQAPAIADFGIKLIHAFFTDLFTSGLPFQLLR